jgi:hypothetical protein
MIFAPGKHWDNVISLRNNTGKLNQAVLTTRKLIAVAESFTCKKQRKEEKKTEWLMMLTTTCKRLDFWNISTPLLKHIYRNQHPIFGQIRTTTHNSMEYILWKKVYFVRWRAVNYVKQRTETIIFTLHPLTPPHKHTQTGGKTFNA